MGVDLIVCPLWYNAERRFHARSHRNWSRACRLCGRMVAVSEAVKRKLDSDDSIVVVCEQCALVRQADLEALVPDEPLVDPEANCPICARLKEQLDSLPPEIAKAQNSKEAAALERKWHHIFNARYSHRGKAHTSTKRGKP